MKTKLMLAALTVAVLAVCAAFMPALALPCAVLGTVSVTALALMPPPTVYVSMTNTIEEMITLPPGSQLTKKAEEAFGSKYLLATEGTDTDEVQVCAANEIPLGPVSIHGSNVAIAADDIVNIDLLCSGKPCLVVASEAITRGEAVYTAASGKVS